MRKPTNLRSRSKSKSRRSLRAEQLEPRELLAADVGFPSSAEGELVAEGESVLSITLDYRFAPAGFFTAPLMQAIQSVADDIASRLNDRLDAITPPTNPDITFTPRTINPTTGNEVVLPANFSVGENELIVFMGARVLSNPGDEERQRGLGGFFEGATSSNTNRLEGLSTLTQQCTDQACIDDFNEFVGSLSRGQSGALTANSTEIAPFAASIAFDSNTEFFTGLGEAPAGQISARDVAAHELGHTLGFGTGFAWNNLARSGSFAGPESIAVNPGNANVPLTSDVFHWADSVSVPTTLKETIDGQLSDLDFAALDDVGWELLPRPVPTVQLSGSTSTTVSESDGTVAVTALLSSLASSNVTLSLTTSGTAGQNDFSLPSTITIPAGSMSASVDLTIIDDAFFESNETVIVNISSPQNATLGTSVQNTITISADSNDPRPSFQITETSAAQAIDEGNTGTTNVTIGVELVGGQLDRPAQVDFGITGSADAMDFTAVTTGPLVFDPSQTSRSITIGILGDTDFEPDETVVVTLNSPTIATLDNANRSATITINNDDEEPQIASLDQQTITAQEGTTVNLGVTLSRIAESDVTLPFTITGPNADFDSVTVSPLVIEQGSQTGTISLTIVQDDFFDPDEEIIVTLGQSATAGVTLDAANSTSTITINDTDARPTVAFATTNRTVTESTDTLDLEVTLTGNLESATSVPFEISGTAENGRQFTVQTASPIQFAAGETTQTISIDLLQDAIFEPTRSIVVTLTEPTGVTGLGTRVSNTITINDDQPEPVQIGFDLLTSNITESDVGVLVAASLNQTFASDLSIPVTIGGTATLGADFAVANATIDIAAGATTGTVLVAIIDDIDLEDDETIVLTLGTTNGVTVDPLRSSTTLTIVDDELPLLPTIQFNTAAAIASESDGTVSYALTLSSASDSDVTIPFFVSGSATGADFNLITSSPIVIPAGETTGTIDVQLNQDSVLDPDETIVLSLGTPTGADLGTNQTLTVTVTDVVPLAQIEFTTASQTVSEANDGSVIVTARLSEGTSLDVTGSISFGGDADASDFSAASTTFTIPAGQTSVDIPITLVNDSTSEPTETLSVSLQNIQGAAIGDQANQIITILDDDIPEGGNRIVIAPLAARAHFVPGDGRPTATIFRAEVDATIAVAPIATTSLLPTNNIQVLNANLESIGAASGSVQTADLQAGELYAVIFPGFSDDRLYLVRSSAGFASLVGAGATNIVSPTDVNADGETTALDALMVVNQMGADTNPEGEQNAVRSDRFYDVNRDGSVTALDALRVINHLVASEALAAESEFIPSAVFPEVLPSSLPDDDIDSAIALVANDVTDRKLVTANDLNDATETSGIATNALPNDDVDQFASDDATQVDERTLTLLVGS